MTHCYEYPRPMVTVDIIVLAGVTDPEILLIQRKNAPFKNTWALPGGFLDMHEDLETAAKRELKEETGIDIQQLKQFRTYGKPGRDPRGRTITIVYTATLKATCNVIAMDDAKDARWFLMDNLPKLAFDHLQIIKEVIEFYSS